MVLVGARGAGKTTLLEHLRLQGVEVLQPTTTRAPRFPGETEYDFVATWEDHLYAWKIAGGSNTYGMRKAELTKAARGTCVTVFDPESIAVFESVRGALGVETLTVGLATIADLPEQHRRVGADPARLMDNAALTRVASVVSECDVVLSGDAGTVAAATMSLIRLHGGRGGVVTKDHLEPLMRAGCMVTDADLGEIRSASYDLRIGSEVLCQGKVTTLTASAPHFEIPAYSYAVVSALENASLPPFVIGRFDLKVSYFFEGVILSNGPQVDPGYKGALFCMLYNGTGRPRLLTLGKHFATIDFTTTTSMTQGYRQKYQLKQKMSQFVTDQAVTGGGGAIVELIDQKVAIVDAKVTGIRNNFWTVAGAVIAVLLLAPTLIVPVAWIEIEKVNEERKAIEKSHERTEELLAAARHERAEAARLLAKTRRTTGGLLIGGPPAPAR